MPGYNETYLQGLVGTVPLIRLQEMERNNEFKRNLQAQQLSRQYDQMTMQDRSRMENQRRLAEVLGETKRHHVETENLGLKNMLSKMQGQLNVGNWQPMSRDGEDVMFNPRTLQVLNPRDGSITSMTNPGSAVVKPRPLSSTDTEHLTTEIEGAGKATRAKELLLGNDVGTARGDPAATGLKGYLPDWLLQRIDSQGVDTRAALTDVGDIKVRERSGKAVPVKEFGRLKSFVPSITDTQSSAIKKLDQFDSEYKRMLSERVQALENSGARVPIPLKSQMERYSQSGGGNDRNALLQQLLEERARRQGQTR